MPVERARKKRVVVLPRGYYTAVEVSEALSLSLDTVYELLRDKRLRGRKGPGNAWLVAKRSLEAFRRRHEVRR